MRRRAAALLVALGACAAPAWAAEAESAAVTPPPAAPRRNDGASAGATPTGPTGRSAGGGVTVTGELIDLKCYVTMGLHGAVHQECAQKCATEHWPVAVLDDTDQRLYPLVIPSAAVAEAAGAHVRVTGTVLQGTELLSPSRLEVERDGTWSDLALPTASAAQ